MSGPTLDWHDAVAVLDLGDGENRFTGDFLEALDAALDDVLEQDVAQALVTHARGRFYCNGYDLDWLARQSRDAQRAFIRDQQRLLARLLVFPLPTVAAISGHAFGAGALLALAHDVRVIRESGADVCLPEIDAKIPLRRAMWALLETRLPPNALRDIALTGERSGGARAVACGLADEVIEAGEDELLARAVALAAARGGKDRSTLARLKSDLYREAFAGLSGSALPSAEHR